MKKAYLFFSFNTFICLKFFGLEIPNNERPEFFFEELVQVLEKLNDRSPVLKSKEFDLDIAQANQVIAKSEQGFKFGLKVSGQSIHEDRPSEDFYHRYRTFNQAYLTKPIFHWGALKAREQIAKLNISWAEDSFTVQRRTLAGEVRGVFLKLIALNYRSQMAIEQLRIATQYVETIEKRLELNLSTPLALEEARVEQLNREISIAELRTSLERNKAYFVSLSGYDEPLSLKITKVFWEFSKSHNFNQEFPILIGSLSNIEVERLQTQVKIEDEHIKIAEAELKPKINLTGAYFQDQVDLAEGRSSLDRNNFLVGLEASWSIWDSHKSTGQKKIALAKKLKLENTIETQNRELRDKVRSVVSELKSLKERIMLGRKLISVAENRLEKSKIELQMDRISPADHFSARVALDQSQLENLEAVCQFMVLLDQYEQIVMFETFINYPNSK
ncbi:TolC family protein [Opitutales bacterium]|uniref:TolC family protein n=1 Tax=Candidatus Chordibacter forsetii TaxID=3381758 RepID=UPI002320C7CA|nr:TolC family protein [bacterium]MDB3957373.1 TolC family protein [Opitutales bacterium]MDC3284228.1 TolC family protein [Opitutales bacterium]